jgi:hypothetical protein
MQGSKHFMDSWEGRFRYLRCVHLLFDQWKLKHCGDLCLTNYFYCPSSFSLVGSDVGK